MAKTFEKAVTGFNHNIKHKGKVYHVQTEDSGASNPHNPTHPFLDVGRRSPPHNNAPRPHLFRCAEIRARNNVFYPHTVGADTLAEHVHEMMEEHHKQMLRNLINGS